MRRGVVLAAVLFVLVAPGGAAAATWYWPMGKLMRLIDETRLRVGTRVVRIHRETTLCSGEGRSIRRSGVRRWSRFACTFTTFTRAGLDRDVDFRVVVTGQSSFRIVDAHWVRAPR